MREIKFRVFDETSEKNEYNYMIGWDAVCELVEHGIFLTDILNREHESLVPMQYTGLKDKNGVEIYEGDIVEYMNEVYVVEFRYGGFVLSRPTQRRKICHVLTVANLNAGVTIIGNIYENKDLLN